MREPIGVGQTGEVSLTVGDAHSIRLGTGGGVAVFSTPSMIDLMEHAARAAIADNLEPGEEPVGMSMDI
ncbi:MAG: hypothetical protein QGH20_02010 [Candidatus Latescibacteria bacterium]|jgi:predicted thioesterase|nr:hypothetical protein [Candidatus Latescibacterota bacterium]